MHGSARTHQHLPVLRRVDRGARARRRTLVDGPGGPVHQAQRSRGGVVPSRSAVGGACDSARTSPEPSPARPRLPRQVTGHGLNGSTLRRGPLLSSLRIPSSSIKVVLAIRQGVWQRHRDVNEVRPMRVAILPSGALRADRAPGDDEARIACPSRPAPASPAPAPPCSRASSSPSSPTSTSSTGKTAGSLTEVTCPGLVGPVRGTRSTACS